MELRHDLHSASRVELPSTLQGQEMLRRTWWAITRNLSPSAIALAGLIGFASCGAAIVGTAAVLALLV